MHPRGGMTDHGMPPLMQGMGPMEGAPLRRGTTSTRNINIPINTHIHIPRRERWT